MGEREGGKREGEKEASLKQTVHHLIQNRGTPLEKGWITLLPYPLLREGRQPSERALLRAGAGLG